MFFKDSICPWDLFMLALGSVELTEDLVMLAISLTEFASYFSKRLAISIRVRI